MLSVQEKYKNYRNKNLDKNMKNTWNYYFKTKTTINFMISVNFK